MLDEEKWKRVGTQRLSVALLLIQPSAVPDGCYKFELNEEYWKSLRNQCLVPVEDHFCQWKKNAGSSCEGQSYLWSCALGYVVLVGHPIQSELFVRTCTSNICTSKCSLQGKRSYDPLTGSCARTGRPRRVIWTRQGSNANTVPPVVFLGRLCARQKSTTPATLPSLVRGSLFSDFGLPYPQLATRILVVSFSANYGLTE